MQKTFEMVTLDLLQGQFTKDQCPHYFRHDTRGRISSWIARICRVRGQSESTPWRLRTSLSRQNFFQRSFDAIEFLTNHTNGLLIARRVRMGRNGLERSADLVVAIPDEM